MTRPEETGLTNVKYAYSYNSIYLLFCMHMGYMQSVSFVDFHIDFCIHNDTYVTIFIENKKLLHFKLSKLGQFLHVHKIGFLRSGNSFTYMAAVLGIYC